MNMNKEKLRMQRLSGLITESQYSELINKASNLQENYSEDDDYDDLIGSSNRDISEFYVEDRIPYKNGHSVAIVMVNGWYTAMLVNDASEKIVKDITAARNYENLLDILKEKYNIGDGSKQKNPINDEDDEDYDDPDDVRSPF
jgi:hypothetical protein